MKTRLSRALLTVILAVSMTVSMMPSFAFADVKDKTAAETQQHQEPAEIQQQEPAETKEIEEVSKEPAVTDEPEKPETVTEEEKTEETPEETDETSEPGAAESEDQTRLLKGANGDEAKAPEEADEELPSGTSNRTVWHLERNEDGKIVLVIDSAGGGLVRANFFQGVKEELGDYADQIEELVVKEGIDRIDQNAFRNITSLKKATLPSTLKNLYSYVFQGCNSLEEINSPDGLTRIDEGCFKDCKSLSQITFPESLTMIGSGAFYGCQSLNHIVIPKNIAANNLKSNAFGNTTGLTDLKIEMIDATGSIPGFPALTELTVGDSVDKLNADYIVLALNNGGNVIFEGENDISLNKGTLKQKARQPFPEIEGNYYADDQGALYKLNDDGTASLAYCSEGPASLTVPEKITTVAGITYTVTEKEEPGFTIQPENASGTIKGRNNLYCYRERRTRFHNTAGERFRNNQRGKGFCQIY